MIHTSGSWLGIYKPYGTVNFYPVRKAARNCLLKIDSTKESTIVIEYVGVIFKLCLFCWYIYMLNF